MQHPDEGTIHAWLDGQLTPDKADEMMAHTSDCLECAALVAEARGLVAASTRILTALDDVPGGVIPAAPTDSLTTARPRRWYDRTDLRAAAAVLFVAGASLLVARGSRNSTESRATLAVADQIQSAEPVADTAAVKAQEPLDEARVSSAPETQLRKTDLKAPSAVASAGSSAAGARARADASPSPNRRAFDTAVMQPQPTSALSASGAFAAPTGKPTDSTGTLREGMKALNEMRLGGIAQARLTAPLRVVSVDSSASMRRTVYEISPGVEVTLAESTTTTEKDLSALQQNRPEVATAQRSAEAPQEKAAAATAGRASGLERTPATATAKAVPPAVAPVTPAPAPLNVISWTDRGRQYTLAGRLTIQQLEAIKTRLMAMRR